MGLGGEQAGQGLLQQVVGPDRGSVGQDQMWPGDREPVTEGPLGLARRVHVSPRYDQAGRGRKGLS